MAEKLSRQTGHCRSGGGGFPAIMAWQLEHILVLEVLEAGGTVSVVLVVMAVEVLEAAGTLLLALVVMVVEVLGAAGTLWLVFGESVRSIVTLSWDSGAPGKLMAGVDSSSF